GSDIPPYGILSHTWEDDGVTFQDLLKDKKLSIAKIKKGYEKITHTCMQARFYDLSYAWIDTCCINKESSAELTEGINSMFQWYKNAKVCFAYLSDLPSGVSVEDGLPKCRWFTRGWTLQELIAPRQMMFYDQEWQSIGTKDDFCSLISSITKIDGDILMGKDHLNTYSVATRMSWAALRNTTRIEDLGYCLMGLFDVNMPLLYGEGSKAFRRLQEIIIDRDNDLTIFAWHRGQTRESRWELFAPSPAAFVECSDFVPYSREAVNPAFSMTNKGLRMENFKSFVKCALEDDKNTLGIPRYLLLLGFQLGIDYWKNIHLALPLSKLGPDVFIPNGRLIERFDDTKSTILNMPTFFIRPDGFESSFSRNEMMVHFPRHHRFKIRDSIAESHWDDTRQLFFRPVHGDLVVLGVLCSVKLGSLISTWPYVFGIAPVSKILQSAACFALKITKNYLHGCFPGTGDKVTIYRGTMSALKRPKSLILTTYVKFQRMEPRIP
ncbi:Vegetative incompatibility protein HET-E-1, partial [Lachnellula suecica]